MGLVNDRFGSDQLMSSCSSKYKSPWGLLDSNTGLLTLIKEPIPANGCVSSLKDVRYFVENGILFISAKKVIWGNINSYLFSVDDLQSFDSSFAAVSA